MEGIPKPGGTVIPGAAPIPPEAGGGGLGELAAKTLPILAERSQERMWPLAPESQQASTRQLTY